MISLGLIKWMERELEKRKKKLNNVHNQLSQLTIIIPSFFRQEYLIRQVILWAFTDATVIIADGTSEPLSSRLIKIISNIPNISYKHLTDPYASRIRRSSNYISTPYAMCLADDDIFLKVGLCHAIDKLNQDHEILACMGQTIGVDYDAKIMRGSYMPYGDSLRSYQVKLQNPEDRIRYAMDGFRSATAYAVYRTNEFKNIWQGIQTSSCLEATEYEHAIATYTLGNLATIEDIYWLKSHECEPVDSDIEGTRATTFNLWWKEEEFKDERTSFVKRLTEKLNTNSNLSSKNAKKMIDEAIGYILKGKHIGLMNQTASLVLITRILNTIKLFPIIDNGVQKLRSTTLGITIRRYTRKIIRGPELQIVESNMTNKSESIELELKNNLILIDAFHAAKRF